MILRDVAHSRTGDKGAIINCSVMPYDERDYDWLVSVVTPERVREQVDRLISGEIVRFLLPKIGAMNFVMSRPAGDGVTRSLALDPHGKSLGSILLAMELPERPERSQP